MPVRDPLGSAPPPHQGLDGPPRTFFYQLVRFLHLLRDRAEGAHGERTINIGAAAAHGQTSCTWTGGTSGHWSANGASAFVSLPIVLPVGSRLKSVVIHGYDGAAVTWKAALRKDQFGPSGAYVVGLTASGLTGTYADLTFNLDEEIADGWRYFVMWTCDTADSPPQRFYGITVTYDHP